MNPTHEVPRINPKSKEICTPNRKKFWNQANLLVNNFFLQFQYTRGDKGILGNPTHRCQGETQGKYFEGID